VNKIKKRAQWHALGIAAFPIVLAAGVLTIPVVTDYSNHLLAEQAAGQTGRWFWGHLVSGIAFGLSILAASSITRYLAAKGQPRAGAISFILITAGGALYAFGLGADGIGPLATAAGGGRAAIFFEGSGMLVSGVFITASILFGFGLIIQVIGILHTGLLQGIIRKAVFPAAIIFLVSTAIPSGWGLYIVAAAALVVYLPISRALWRESVILN